MSSRLAQHANYLISISVRREQAQPDWNDLDAAKVVYKVKLAGAATPQMEKAAAPLRVELEAFEIAEIAVLRGDLLELELIPEGGSELNLSTQALSEQGIHRFRSRMINGLA